MSQTQSQQSTQPAGVKQTRVLAADDHRHGLTIDTPISVIFMLAILIPFLCYFLFLQIAGTENTVAGLLQSRIHASPGMTAQQITEMYSASLDHNQQIGYAIGIGTEIVLLLMMFPATRTSLLLHKKYGQMMSTSIARRAVRLAKVQGLLFAFIIIFNLFTDALYAAMGHQVFGGMSTLLWFIPVPSVNDPGALVAAMLYPAVVIAVNFFGGKRVFVYIEQLVEHFTSGKQATA